MPVACHRAAAQASLDESWAYVQERQAFGAPIAQYQRVGTLKLMADDKLVNQVPLLALEPVNQATIIGRAFDSVRLMLYR